MTTPTTKCIVICHPHHLDHLAPMSYYENIPLVPRNTESQQTLIEFYPWASYRNIGEFDFMATIDEIISTSKTEIPMVDTHQALYQKKPKLTRVHHGYSDKVQDFSDYDEIIDYKDRPNYRLRFYQEFRSTLLETARRYLPLPPESNFLLIALSWDRPNVEEQLKWICSHPKKGRFVFRIHPFLAETDWMHIKLEAHYGVHILSHECPYIYPFLELCAGVLTDTSSIGYDALYFEKPLMVLDEIPLKRFSSKDIDTWIAECDQKLPRPHFKKAYHDIFG